MYTVRYKSHHDASRNLKIRYAAAVTGEAYLPTVLAGSAQSRRVIYIHVPFCNKVCSFCPFHRPDALDRRTYHEELIREIRRVSIFPYMQAPVEAVNFGGGTPTSLSPAQMAAVLSALHTHFRIAPDAEISVETSATELTDAMLDSLVSGGVNRLSVGIQTFDDGARRLLGRRGSGAAAAARVAAAMARGISNTSVDLIYNYPGQTDGQLASDLHTIRALDVAGVSIYSLMLHEKTPLYRRLTETERQALLDLRREKALFDRILDTLGADGYRMLELTKLVKGGRDRYDYMEIRHSGGSCIALGRGAGGNIENYFYHNAADAPVISERIPFSASGRVFVPAYRRLDALVYAMQKGVVDLGVYSAQLDVDLKTLFSEKLERLCADGFVMMRGDTLSLTRDGLFFGNNIISELIDCIAPEKASPAQR